MLMLRCADAAHEPEGDLGCDAAKWPSSFSYPFKDPSGHVMRQHSAALVRLQSLHRDESAADGVRTLS